MPEDIAGSPLLAVLSTVVIEDDLEEAKGALCVGLTECADELESCDVAPGAPVRELVGTDATPGTRRFVIPAPNGHPLALVAEFVISDRARTALGERIQKLMCSFRWQAA